MIKGAKFLLCGKNLETEQSLMIEGHISLSKAQKAAKKKKLWKDKSIWQLVWREKEDKDNNKQETYYGENF